MLEKTLEKKCCDYAKAQGWLPFKFVSPNNRGVPDRLFIRNGVTVYVEFKQLGKKPTPLQTIMIEKIRAAGATVHVIDNYETFTNVMS